MTLDSQIFFFSLLCVRIFILIYADLSGPISIKKPDIILPSVVQADVLKLC